MDAIIDAYIHDEIMNAYEKDKENIEKSISDYGSYIFNKYKQKYPLRLASIYYLEEFGDKFRKLALLPSKDEYEKISREKELIDVNIYFPIYIDDQDCILQIPLIVNVSKLSRFIESQDNINKISFYTDALLTIMAEDYQADYERDNEIRIEKRDILFEERKKNPIIVMQEGKAAKLTIINGNHRIMYYSRIGTKEVKGYYVTPELCCKYALTKDYETLYTMVLHLIDKVRGSIHFKKST